MLDTTEFVVNATSLVALRRLVQPICVRFAVHNHQHAIDFYYATYPAYRLPAICRASSHQYTDDALIRRCFICPSIERSCEILLPRWHTAWLTHKSVMKTCTPPVTRPKITAESPQAFEYIYRQYAKTVYQTCLRVTKDSMAAEDYTQDVFIKVFEKLHLFQHRSMLSTWLYSIAYNHCLTQLRIGKRLLVNSLPDDDEQTNSLASELPDTLGELTDAAWQAQEAALRTLHPADLKLLQLKYEQGLSIEELGQRYNLSTSAVKMRLKRCRDRANVQFRRYYPA